MADLRISELTALSGANLAAGDLLPIVDVSASETKKITVTDLVGNATTLIADATIPSAKVLFGSGSIVAASLATDAVTTAKIQNDAVTAAKLADESTVDLVTTLPGSGAFVGQIALDTDDSNAYIWNGSSWVSFKAAGSVGSVVGSTAGTINIVVTTSGNDVTISATLDNTSAAAQFLAGPAANAGAVSYRTITGADLPAPTTSARGGVAINGEGLRMDGAVLEIDNDVTANVTYGLVTYSAKGLVTNGRTIISSDLPAATSVAKGAVIPGTGLSVDGSGNLNHTNSATPGTYTKVTVDSQGHISSGTTLASGDLPNHSAALLTSGSLDIARIDANSITGAKLANYAVSKIGETQPTADHIGQFFFNPLSRDLFLWDGNVFQPIGISVGEIVFAGTFDASSGGGTGLVASVTAEGTAIGLVVGQALPAAATANNRYYLVVSEAGTITSGNAPQVALTPPDIILSNGANWTEIDVSQTITAQVASNVSFTPAGDIAATNVQTAIEEVDTEKLAKAGGTVTGELLIGTSGSFAFEGTSSNAYETYLAVVDPTADRTITFPDISGTVITSGDTGTVTSTMIADGTIVNADINASAAIADTKLATISTAGKVSNSATTATSANTASAIVARDASGNFSAGTITATGFSGSGASLTSLTAGNLSGTIPSGVLGNSSLFVGTTSLALNRGSANQALTGISSIALPGSTSGTLTIQPAATAGVNTITFPAVTGNVVTTGDTGTVTGTMIADNTIVNAEIASNAAIAYSKLNLAGSIVNADIGASAAIADTKLATISTAGKVSNSATTATNANTASAIVARDASGNFSAGTITAALSGNASTATTLATARTIQGVSFNGSANITVVTAGTGISVTGTAVANTGVLSVNGSTGAVTNVAVTNAAQSFSAAQRGSVSALTSAATVTPDFAVANNFSLTLGHSITLANPTNLTAGQSGSIVITQGAATAYTVAYGANWKFSGGTPTMSTGLSSVSTLVYYVESATRITAQLLTNVA